MTVLIKRYGNRKLYDTQASRYVTLDRIAEMVRAGRDLRIVDNDTGEDLTAVIFAQIIFEEQKRKNGGLLGLPVLRWIIQQGGATLQEILTSVDRGREALGSMRELAEKGMKQLAQSAGMQTGGAQRPGAHGAGAHTAANHGPGIHGTGPRASGVRGAGPQGRRLLEEILEVPQRQIEQLQHRIDEQVRASLDRLAAHPAVQNELRRIERNVKALERQLHRFRGAERRVSPARRAKPRTASKGAGR
jgi:polyhydroxyalkanoate synthesis repressor PhaR